MTKRPLKLLRHEVGDLVDVDMSTVPVVRVVPADPECPHCDGPLPCLDCNRQSEDTKVVAKRVADGLRAKHPDFDWAKLARTLMPLYDARQTAANTSSASSSNENSRPSED